MTRLASRTSRLRRIEELLLLTPDGMRAVDLADKLEVDRRTVYRDVDFLCDQGLPIWQKDGRFGMNRTRYLTTVHLSFHEAIALTLAGLLLARTIDERNPHVTSALRKLAITLPNAISPHLKRAADRVQTLNDGQRQVAVLEALAEGWGTGRKVRVGYRSPRSGQLRERVIAPYALEPTPSGIYVIGHDDWAKDIRTFKLDRLESATLLSRSFTVPEAFDLESHLASGWRIMAGSEITDVVLRFTPEVTPHIYERQWHPTQKLEKTEDGGCLLSVQVAQPQEMQPFIRSWGAQVEVLAPDWLRAQIGQELQQAAAQYSERSL
ncbi:MAG: transcriptional regulator [Ardenticatenaceae bacterium]|nr:transcriptional regulator [Anaerolineales bacterium]MCB8979467.1 transcriptional regulator [Ardenticatenaceae bacterium]